MLNYFTIAAAALIRAAAFTTIPAFSRAWPVDIQVSTDFTELETQAIAFAASSWNTALGSNALRLWYAPGPTAWKQNGVSTLSKYTGPSGGTYLWANYGHNTWRVIESDVVVSNALSSNAFYNTVLHELGHVLGLEHSSSSPIMGSMLQLAPNGTPLPTSPIAVSDDDVAGINSLSLTQYPW